MTEPMRAAPPAAEDEAWLERIVASGRTGVIRNFPFAVARRILMRLRAAQKDGRGRCCGVCGEDWSDHRCPSALDLPAPVVRQEPRVQTGALERASEELRKARAFYARQGCWDNEQDAQAARDALLAQLRALEGTEDRQSGDDDAETERQMQEAWRKDLEDAVADAIHTLENEVHAGTKFNEPEWVEATLAMLRRVAPPLPSDATQRQD